MVDKVKCDVMSKGLSLCHLSNNREAELMKITKTYLQNKFLVA